MLEGVVFDVAAHGHLMVEPFCAPSVANTAAEEVDKEAGIPVRAHNQVVHLLRCVQAVRSSLVFTALRRVCGSLHKLRPFVQGAQSSRRVPRKVQPRVWVAERRVTHALLVWRTVFVERPTPQCRVAARKRVAFTAKKHIHLGC
eukprot:3371258-Prymnesium_polylepis.2